ncbi:MAG TPA: S9 family peptidase [Vicinamibacterales bacterium]|nr:S9 family peptidase [Vicinamibacterales bacterium]
MRWFVWIPLLALTACGGHPRDTSAPPAAAPAMTVEDVLAIWNARSPFWAPDARRIGFTWGLGRDTNFWAADAAAAAPASPGGATVRQIAPQSGRASAAVSRDWKWVAYVAQRQIWRIPLAGGRPERITTKPANYSALNWSPDAARIAFIVDDGRQTDVGVVPAAGGAVTMIADTARDEDSPIWSPDSTHVAYIRRFENWQGYDVRISDVAGGNQRQIVTERYEKGVEEYHFGGNANWSPDGRRLAYLSSRDGYNHVWTVPVDGGVPTALTSGAFVDYDPAWSPDGSRIVFVSSRSGDREERHIWIVSAGGGAPTRVSADGFCTDPVWSPDGTRVAYLRSSATEPPEVVVQDVRAGAAARRLTESRPRPALTAHFVEPEAVTYTSRDGTKVPAILLRPRGTDTARPALMYFHGKGGINLKGWGGLPNYAFHQLLVQQGYAILFVNWRGTHIGYGAAFEQANYRDYGGGELEDVRAGAEFLARDAHADPHRIACWGGSYGGYMTMLAITKAPDVCSAGISLYGVSDWAAFTKQNQRRLWNYRLFSKLGRPETSAALYDRAAAIKYVDGARAPLLILQGTDDDGVVPAQGESLYDAMRKAGKRVEYVAYTGEGHGFRGIGSLRDMYERTLAFLNAVNGGGAGSR